LVESISMGNVLSIVSRLLCSKDRHVLLVLLIFMIARAYNLVNQSLYYSDVFHRFFSMLGFFLIDFSDFSRFSFFPRFSHA
jgi:hypothetical protein